MFIGEFKSASKEGEDPAKKDAQKIPEQSLKSDTFSEFLKHPETRDLEKQLIKEGSTKRGVRALFAIGFRLYDSDHTIREETKNTVLMILNKDGYSKALGGLKAKTEGAIKAIKGIIKK